MYIHIRFLVEGGHRAIIFGRIGGIKPHIMAEGLHFRVPWFEYPIIYDIRAKPRTMSSPTGSKDLQMVNKIETSSKDLMGLFMIIGGCNLIYCVHNIFLGEYKFESFISS